MYMARQNKWFVPRLSYWIRTDIWFPWIVKFWPKGDLAGASWVGSIKDLIKLELKWLKVQVQGNCRYTDFRLFEYEFGLSGTLWARSNRGVFEVESAAWTITKLKIHKHSIRNKNMPKNQIVFRCHRQISRKWFTLQGTKMDVVMKHLIAYASCWYSWSNMPQGIIWIAPGHPPKLFNCTFQ